MAAITTGVVLGGASLYGAYKGGKAADRAADVQEAAQEQNIAAQQEQQEYQREAMAPFQEAGGLALEKQQALTGLLGPEAQQLAYDEFKASPAQQFMQEQGLRMVNTGSATSGAGGGERLRELTKFGQGLALQQFDDYYNRLGGISGTGYNATTGGLSLDANTLSNQAAARENQAAARAGGVLGRQDAYTKGAEQIAGLAGRYLGAYGGASPTGGLSYNAPINDINTQYGGYA